MLLPPFYLPAVPPSARCRAGARCHAQQTFARRREIPLQGWAERSTRDGASKPRQDLLPRCCCTHINTHTHPLTCTMLAPCAGSLAAALLLVKPIQVNLLGYTGSNGLLRGLNSLAKAILKRAPDRCESDERTEEACMMKLFLEYKTQMDPERIKDGLPKLTVRHDMDPWELCHLAQVLSLEATAGLQVHPLSSPRLVLWQQLKEWRRCG